MVCDNLVDKIKCLSIINELLKVGVKVNFMINFGIFLLNVFDDNDFIIVEELIKVGVNVNLG